MQFLHESAAFFLPNSSLVIKQANREDDTQATTMMPLLPGATKSRASPS
jgi:hypothetical protein